MIPTIPSFALLRDMDNMVLQYAARLAIPYLKTCSCLARNAIEMYFGEGCYENFRIRNVSFADQACCVKRKTIGDTFYPYNETAAVCFNAVKLNGCILVV